MNIGPTSFNESSNCIFFSSKFPNKHTHYKIPKTPKQQFKNRKKRFWSARHWNTCARTCLGRFDPCKNTTASAPLILPSLSKSAIRKYASNTSVLGDAILQLKADRIHGDSQIMRWNRTKRENKINPTTKFEEKENPRWTEPKKEESTAGGKSGWGFRRSDQWENGRRKWEMEFVRKIERFVCVWLLDLGDWKKEIWWLRGFLGFEGRSLFGNA